MSIVQRHSPVSFRTHAVKTENRNGWNVVLEYEDEGEGMELVDLSHKTRWDVQDADLGQFRPCGAEIPEFPGVCQFENGILINRMNRTQAAVWHISNDDNDLPEDPAFTDVTESTVFLALLGSDLFSIAEKLSSLDFLEPSKETPFLFQGPFSHIPCQIVTMDKGPAHGGIFLTCSRGYGQDMVAAILEAGKEFGLRPVGELALNRWIEQAAGSE